MIAPMKKLTVLLYHKQKEQFLEALRDVGVVHIVERVDEPTETLVRLSDGARRAERVRRSLETLAKSRKLRPEQTREGDVEAAVETFEALEAQRDAAVQEISALRKQVTTLEPWGDFEPEAVARLEVAGVKLRFFEAARKKFGLLDMQTLTYSIVRERADRIYFVVLQRGETADIAAEEVALPVISLRAAGAAIAEREKKLGDIDRELERLTSYRDVLSRHVAAQREQHTFETARLSMEETAGGRVVALEGWVPADKEKSVAEFLDTYHAWHSMTAAARGDTVPILLRNNAFSRLFEPITRIFQLPSYFELDPTFAIAPFFAVFFGNCLGDSGYGLMIIVAALVGYFKVPKQAKGLAGLGVVLGCATLVMGVFNTGTVFGVPIGEYSNVPVFRLLGKGVLIRQSAAITPFGFALLLGVIQMSFGMVLNIVNSIRYKSFAAALPGIGRMLIVDSCIVMFLVLNQKMEALRFLLVPAYAGSGVGTALILYVAFFTQMEQYLEGGAGSRFANFLLKMYFVVSGAVGDVLSYIRLFALGLSSGILGYVVNAIGVQLRDAIPVFGWPVFIVFLAVGHTSNLLLSALSSFVHPLRLTFVEFYNNLVFTGGGIEYRPLRRTVEGSRI